MHAHDWSRFTGNMVRRKVAFMLVRMHRYKNGFMRMRYKYGLMRMVRYKYRPMRMVRYKYRPMMMRHMHWYSLNMHVFMMMW